MNNNQKGFLTLDVLSACALIALIMAYAYQANEHINTSLKINKVRIAAETFAQDLRKLQRNTMFQSSGGALSIYNEMVLYDAGKYIQGVLEKDLGYESTLINIRKDSRNLHILECQNVYGNKTITIYMEDVRLLKKIKTGNGTGTNTLYINGCNVEDWSVEALDTKNLRISFCLKKNECKKFFQQIVYCYNGEVTINA